MEQILRLIEHYGYLVVFFGVMLESTGVPLPGETILLASGFLAQQGHLDVGDAILVGILVGGSIGLVERWLGRATLLLAVLVAVVVGFYLVYRWVVAHRALLAGYGKAALSYPPVARLRSRYDAQLSWLFRRLSPGQYLGLHLTLGLAAAAGCLWLFGGLAEDVLTNDPLVRYDRAVADYLHSSATPPLT